ncbi:MAG: hypothetical protein K5761_05695 [Clostridiales bacterium]|nr:hypothetical protein [Clostridiales bacterium]
MKCPKCGGEIPFYDLKPNCRHCGINIMYYIQDYQLERDAKRTELESAGMRMTVAKIKASFIGSLLSIFRMVFVVGAICAMMIPFASVTYKLPFYEEKLSVGLIGIIGSFGNGMLLDTLNFYKSSLFSGAALGVLTVLAFFAMLAIADVVIFCIYLLSFLNPDKTTKAMRNISVCAAVLSLGAQIAAVICRTLVVPEAPNYVFALGFGGLACFVLHLVLVFINTKMLKKGVEPVYREYDPKRRELLKKVKKGEIDLDDLPLPVFESEEERENRLREFQHAMEEEDKEEQETMAEKMIKEEEERTQ